MKTSKHFFRKFIILVLALSLVLSVFLLAGCNNNSTKPEDDNKDDNNTTEEKVDNGYIKNGTFEFLFDNSTSTSNYPRNPKNWTYASAGADEDKAPSDSDYVSYGVMDFSEEVFNANKDKFADKKIPTVATSDSKDKRLLMINNKKATAGAFTSTSISLPANSYVAISVKVQTNNISKADQGANISIIEGLEEDIILKNINTNGEWKEYKFYIETSAVNAKNIKIKLGLGFGDRLSPFTHVEGFAYFDDIKLDFITKADYEKVTATTEFKANGVSNNDNIYNCDKTDNASIKYSFAKDVAIYDFDTTNPAEKVINAGTNTVKLINANDTIYQDLVKVKDKDGNFLPLPFNKTPEDQVYMLNNTTKSTSSLAFNEIISVEQNSYYKLSFYVKTSKMLQDTGLNINLYELVGGEPQYNGFHSYTKIDTTKHNISATDKEFETNKNQNWELYSIAISGNGFSTKKLGIEFKLGTNLIDNDITNGNVDNGAKGYAFINNIAVEKITNEEFNSFPTDYKAAKVYLENLTDSGINNGNFNTPNGNNFEFDKNIYNDIVSAKDFLVLPQGHKNVGGNGTITVPNSSNDFAAGIVNSNFFETLKKNSKIDSSLDSKVVTTKWGNPNTFMIWNKQPTSIGLLSSKFALSQDKVYKISLRLNVTDKANASIYLIDAKTNEIAKDENGKNLEFTNKGAATTNTFDNVLPLGDGWAEYTFFVRTKDLTKDYKIEVWNGSRNDAKALSAGTIFIDNIKLSEFNAKSFDDNKVEYAAEAWPTKDFIKFADFKTVDVVEPEKDEEKDPAIKEEETKKENKFDWTLFSVTTSSALLLASFAVVAIVRFKKKGFFAKTKSTPDQKYKLKKVKKDKDEDEEENEEIEITDSTNADSDNE